MPILILLEFKNWDNFCEAVLGHTVASNEVGTDIEYLVGGLSVTLGA